MAKKVVRKSIYLIFTTLYHFFCLSGLLWQVTKISINYFKFDAISDIKVIMPEESEEVRKAVNICFQQSEMVNPEEYMKYVSKYRDEVIGKDQFQEKILDKMTLRERFELIPELPKLFYGSYELVTKYMMNTYICFHVRNQRISQSFGFVGEAVRNASTVLVSLSYPLPNVEETRFKAVSITDDETELELLVRSFSYQIIQLPFPYTDNCFNYQTIRLHSRDHARRNCSNEIVKTKKSSYGLGIVTLDDTNLLDMRNTFRGSRSILAKCVTMYARDDCDKKTIFTQVETLSKPISVGLPDLRFSKQSDYDPSFVVQSKPRIDDIDFVTYILGALGSWLGFSFLGVNPILYLVTTQEAQDTDVTPISPDRLAQVKKDCLQNKISNRRLDLKYWRHEDAIKRLEGRFNRLIDLFS